MQSDYGEFSRVTDCFAVFKHVYRFTGPIEGDVTLARDSGGKRVFSRKKKEFKTLKDAFSSKWEGVTCQYWYTCFCYTEPDAKKAVSHLASLDEDIDESDFTIRHSELVEFY